MTTRTKPAPGGPLARVSAALSAPLPARTRIVHELCGDLHELTERLVAEGVPPAEARRRAADALVPDDETLRRLDHVHASWYARLTRSRDARRLRRAERAALLACFAALLLVETAALLQTDVLRYRSPFLWPVLVLGSVVVLAVLAKAFELWVKRDHRALRRGLRALLVLAGVTLGVALAGSWFDVVLLATTLERSPELTDPLVLRALIQEASLLVIALLFGLFGAVGWLAMTQWIAVQEDAHRNALALSTPYDEENRSR
jgi:hypothetical protein